MRRPFAWEQERDELAKRLAAKDREVAEHVDRPGPSLLKAAFCHVVWVRKVEEVLKKQGATKDQTLRVS